MSDPIISIEQIKREAKAAAKAYADVNDACPYPFNTDAGRIFRLEFNATRRAMKTQQQEPTP